VALLVGAGVACALGMALGKPVLGVHHLEGHLLSPFLSADPPEFPFVALLVSGGHTELILMKKWLNYEIIGETVDDAVGEAFDKVAKMLGLPYPGGPAIAHAAQKGDPYRYNLPIARMKNPYDFSFSGLKTAVLRAIQKEVGVLTIHFHLLCSQSV
jgi:N6-L-threonylcarbamoyladenine synthase